MVLEWGAGVGVTAEESLLLPPQPAKSSATHPVNSRIFICAAIGFIILHKVDVNLLSNRSILPRIFHHNTHMGNVFSIFIICLTLWREN